MNRFRWECIWLCVDLNIVKFMFHTVLISTLFGSVVTFGFGSKFEFDGLDAVAFSLGMINILN